MSKNFNFYEVLYFEEGSFKFHSGSIQVQIKNFEITNH